MDRYKVVSMLGMNAGPISMTLAEFEPKDRELLDCSIQRCLTRKNRRKLFYYALVVLFFYYAFGDPGTYAKTCQKHIIL